MEENTEQNLDTPKNPSKMIVFVVFVGILLIGLGYFYFRGRGQTMVSDITLQGTDQKSNSTTATDLPVGNEVQKTEVNGVSTESEMAIISVEGGNYYFKPNQIRVKFGEKVTIKFTNMGGTHNFIIDELNVNSGMVDNGNTKTVEFTPDKKGEFEFYCSVGNHRQMGMKGMLNVE